MKEDLINLKFSCAIIGLTGRKDKHMKKNLFNQYMMTVIVSGKTKRWLEDMTNEYKRDHPCNEYMTIGISAAILLETMCTNYENKGLWKDKKGE